MKNRIRRSRINLDAHAVGIVVRVVSLLLLTLIFTTPARAQQATPASPGAVRMGLLNVDGKNFPAVSAQVDVTGVDGLPLTGLRADSFAALKTGNRHRLPRSKVTTVKG